MIAFNDVHVEPKRRSFFRVLFWAVIRLVVICTSAMLLAFIFIRPAEDQRLYYAEIMRAEKRTAPITARAMVNVAEPYLTAAQQSTFARQLAEAEKAGIAHQTEKYSAIISDVFTIMNDLADKQRAEDRDIYRTPEEIDRENLLNDLGASFRSVTRSRKILMQPTEGESTVHNYQEFKDAQTRLSAALEKYQTNYQKQ